VAKKVSKERANRARLINGVEFDHGKSEAMLFSRKRKTPTATVTSGGREIPLNHKAARWLGIWLEPTSPLTGNDEEGKECYGNSVKLVGQMGLTSSNCRKVMTACVQVSMGQSCASKG